MELKRCNWKTVFARSQEIMMILQCPSSEQWVQYTSVSAVTFIKNRETTPQQTLQEKNIISNKSQPWLRRIIRLQKWTCVSSVNSNYLKISEWPNRRFWSHSFVLIKEFHLSLLCGVFFGNAQISGWLKGIGVELKPNRMLARLWQGQSLFHPPGQRGFKQRLK